MTERMIQLCIDDELGYRCGRTVFVDGTGLELDEAYRLAHLPLVSPRHPRVIPSRPGTFYDRGGHPRVHSLALPIAADLLEQSPAYCALEQELRAAPFAAKIAWDLLDRRRSKLHATVCGSLATGRNGPSIDPGQRRALADIGAFHVEVRGLFSGNVNVGRLYLRLYPSKHDGRNVVQDIQRALGRPVTDLYVVGVWNLTDDLEASEAAVLKDIIERWWERPVLNFEADHLWLLAASDDLVLESEVTEIVRLRASS